MGFALHLTDLLRAPRLSHAQAKRRLADGWQLVRLAPHQHYCSAGAAGSYAHALCGPDGQLAQLTQRAAQGLAGVERAPEVVFDTTQVFLNVPFADKDEACAQGALWDAAARRWWVTPAQARDRAQALSRWLDSAGLAGQGNASST